MSRGAGSDGIKRGTNYMQRALIEQRRRVADAELVAYFSQAVRCGRGEHDETTARLRYVTYVRGRQVRPGTRYCRYCSTILPEKRGGEDSGGHDNA